GALGGAAAAALVGPPGADAGVAGTLLAEELLGAAGHLAAAEGRVGAGPLVGEVHQDDVVEQLAVDDAAELRGVDVDLPDLGAFASGWGWVLTARTLSSCRGRPRRGRNKPHDRVGWSTRSC